MPAPRPVRLQDASDRALVSVVLSDQSEEAYRHLYRRHTDRLYRLAWRMLGSEMDAEDVVQETWLRAVSQLAGFGWRSSLGTWLCGIALNVAREHLTLRGRWTDDESSDELARMDDDRDAQRLDIERAIATLPPACRAVFLLHDVEGFTHEEIAEQLGLSAGTSKTQVFRARRALRRLLADLPDGQRSVIHDR
jgi:RNA polymerase sigma-70 factor (ECF subfamily)